MKTFEEEYSQLREWLNHQLDEAAAQSIAPKLSEDPVVVAARKNAIAEYNRKLNDVKRRYAQAANQPIPSDF